MDDPEVRSLLERDDEPVDTAAGLRRFRAAARGVRAYEPRIGRIRRGLAAAAAIAVVFALFTASGVADTVFKIFEPKQVAPVGVTSADLAGLPSASKYGTIKITLQPVVTKVTSEAEAAAKAGFAAPVPGSLPSGVPTTAELSVVSPLAGTFTFDPTKAPGMPTSIAATVLTGTGGPGIAIAYGGSFDQKSPNASSLPALVVTRAKAPIVTSNGASLEDLRAYLLAQPGVSPQLAAQIRAIGDPASTLPILVPLDLATSKPVTVHAVPGVLVGDSTGLGIGVIWLENGFLNVVGGTLTESQILGVANSLR